MRARRR